MNTVKPGYWDPYLFQLCLKFLLNQEYKLLKRRTNVTLEFRNSKREIQFTELVVMNYSVQDSTL